MELEWQRRMIGMIMVRGLGEWAGISNLPARHPTCQDHPLLHQPEGIQISMKAVTHYCSTWLWSCSLKMCEKTAPCFLFLFFFGKVLNWISTTTMRHTFHCHQQRMDIASAVNSLKDSQIGWRDRENTLASKKQIHPYAWLNAQHAHTTSWRGEHTVNAQKEFSFPQLTLRTAPSLHKFDIQCKTKTYKCPYICEQFYISVTEFHW